jgi:hypothetical protein
MKIPAPTMPQTDPMLQQQADQAKQDNLLALQDRVKGDSASLMARFGALAALTQPAKG